MRCHARRAHSGTGAAQGTIRGEKKLEHQAAGEDWQHAAVNSVGRSHLVNCSQRISSRGCQVMDRAPSLQMIRTRQALGGMQASEVCGMAAGTALA